MPPKNKFTREEIVEAAFEVAKEEGFSKITARSVAGRLKSSVAPIYVNFKTIDELVQAVVQRVFALSEELLAKQKGQNLFKNIGKASLAFARDYPVLFRELVLKPNPYMTSYEETEKAMIETLKENEEMKGWNVEERRRLFLKMRIFQLGLSAMVANGHLPSWLDDQECEKLLNETGEQLLLAEQVKRKEDKQ
ncbi:MAG: TetR/AcrR family transcriptional regulator [Bacillota bacterium]